MAASIGKGSLILTANAKPLDEGLANAHSRITQWSAKVNTSVGSGLSFAGIGKLAAPLTVMKTAFDAVRGVVDDFTDSIADISGIGRQARGLGIDPGDLQALGNAAKRAGVDLPEFGQMFGKLQAKIASGGQDTAAALGSIGLNLQSLQGMSGKDAMFSIADGLASVSDAGTRSAVAMKLFEESGLKLLPMLSKGGAGLQSFIDAQKAAGNVLSGSQFKDAEKAEAAMTRVGESFTGVWNRIVVAVAPMVANLGDALADVMGKLQPILQPALNGLAEYLELVGRFWGQLLVDVVDGVTSITASFGEWVGALDGVAGKIPSVGEIFLSIIEAVATAGAYAWDTLKVGAAGVTFALTLIPTGLALIVRGIKNVVSAAELLPEWMGGGAATDAVKFLGEIQAELELKAEALGDWSAKQLKNFGNTAVGVHAWFDKLRQKKEDALDMSGTVGQIGAITNALANTNKGGNKPDMGAILKGSAEDYSIRASFSWGKIEKANEPVVRAIDKLTDVQKKALDRMPDRQNVAGAAIELGSF